jgi:hypothetical protein
VEALGFLTAEAWQIGRAPRAAASVLEEATYVVVAPRRPMGNRGSETERSPVGAAAVSPVVASRSKATRAACRRSVHAYHERWLERRWRHGAEGPAASTWTDARARAAGAAGVRVAPGLPPRTKFVVVGEAHEVAIPRGLKVQAPEPDFEPGSEGVRVAHGIPLVAVLGVNHHREGWCELIFSATPLPGAPTVDAECSPDTN